MLIDKNIVKKNKEDEICETKNWQSNRWKNVSRDYTAEDVKKIKTVSKSFNAGFFCLKDDNNYFLVTPVEKVPVKVELAPYKVIDFEISKNNIKLLTNMNYDFVLNALNTTRLIAYNNSEIPLVHVRNNIEGFFDRNIYYKFVDLALDNNYIENKLLYVPSNNHNHIIGNIA